MKKIFLLMLVCVSGEFALAGKTAELCVEGAEAIIPAHTQIFTISNDCGDIRSRYLAVKMMRAAKIVKTLKCSDGSYSIVRMLPTKNDPYGDIFSVKTESLIK